MVCEDSNMDFYGLWPENTGPYAAIQEFMKDNSCWFEDKSRELYITTNPHGFLLKKC